MELINNKYVLVNNNYFICTKKRKFVQVDGKRLIIKGFEDFEFFFYKQDENIIICEAFTGTKVNTVEGGFVKVLRTTNDNLCDLGKIELTRMFKLLMKITKLSPRYRYVCIEGIKN